jgi:hypothetical protein
MSSPSSFLIAASLLVPLLTPTSAWAQGSVRKGAKLEQQPLVAVLRDPEQDSERRLQALALLAYLSRPLKLKSVTSVHHLARGGALADYARCLGLCGREALPNLRALRTRRDPDAAAEVMYARVLLEDDGTALALATLRERKQIPRVRVAALRALADLESPFAVVEALRRLEMETGLLLYESLAVLRRNPSSDHIPYLIDLLQVSTGRAANEAVAMLQTITGYRIANNYKSWKYFYLKHKADGTPFRRAADGSTAESSLSYMGVPIYSDRIVFSLDSSSSMGERMAAGALETRSTRAVNELVYLLPHLPASAALNVLFFDSEVSTFADGLIDISADVQAQIADFTLDHGPQGGTNLFGGLDEAFRQDGVEEIILLTDGAPSVGEIVEPLHILARVARYNRWQLVRISTVSLRAPRRAEAFLNRLAEENLGVCKILR